MTRGIKYRQALESPQNCSFGVAIYHHNLPRLLFLMRKMRVHRPLLDGEVHQAPYR